MATRRRGFYEITDDVKAWVGRNGSKSDLVSLLVRHTSASLLIQENADLDARRDSESFLRGWCRAVTRCSST